MSTRIRLASLNSSGLVASIVDDYEGESVDLVLRRQSDDAKRVCKLAAKRLRKLASAFERLSEMDKPTHCATQLKAMKEALKE